MQHRRCTLRTTVGLLLVLALACNDDAVAPTSGAAGHVISLQGHVRATRDGQAARVLKVEDVIFGDDTIATGAGASIEMRLHHNGARWQLGANAQRRVESSVAWRAQKQDVAILDPSGDIKTGSAGRNTTREAAESRETLLNNAESEESAEAAEPAEPAEPVQPVGGLVGARPGESRQQSGPRAGSKSGSSRPEARDDDRKPSRDNPGKGRSEGSGATLRSFDIQQTGSAVEPRPEATPSLDAESDGATADKRKKEVEPPAATLRSRVIALAKACHAKHSGRGSLAVTLTVKDDTLASLAIKAPASLEAVRTCLDAGVRAAALPDGGPTTITLQLP